jgi:hypothetical protein
MIESKKISPILYSLLALAAQKQTQEIVTGVKKVIEFCKDIATLMSQHNNDNVINVAVQTVINSSKEVKETGNIASIIHAFLGVYFPGRPIVRNVKTVSFAKKDVQQCTKFYQSNTRLGSGVVLFWCAKHRVCLGWVFLQSAESLEVVYNTILTRFPEIPRIICYDNACNLAEYCYNRAPK